jgi:hypothetical protein
MIVIAGIFGIVIDERASLLEQRDDCGVSALAGEPNRRATIDIRRRSHRSTIQQQPDNLNLTAFRRPRQRSARVEAVAVHGIRELRRCSRVFGSVENRTHSGQVGANDGGVQIHSTMNFLVVVVVTVMLDVARGLSTQMTGRPNSAQSVSSLSGGQTSDSAWQNAVVLSQSMPMGDNMFATTPACACASQHLLLTRFVNLDSDRALRDKPLDVPDMATIRGIEVVVHRSLDASAIIDETDVVLVRAGAVLSANLAGKGVTNAARWPPIQAATSFSYGGRTNLWGVATPLTPAIVNDDSFGVAFRVRSQAASGVARVDYVRLSIFYDTPDGMIPPKSTLGADGGGTGVPVSPGGSTANTAADGSNINVGSDPTASAFNQGMSSSSPDGDNVGLIVGVVVGVLLCCLLVAVVAFLLLKRNKREKHGDIHTESFAFEQPQNNNNMMSARSQRAGTGAHEFPDVPDSSRRGTNVQSNYVSSPNNDIAAQQAYGGIQPSVQMPQTDGYGGSGARRATSPSNYASTTTTTSGASGASAPYGTRPTAATMSSIDAPNSNYGSGRAAPLQYNKAIDIHGHDQYNQRPVHQQFGN